MKKILAFVIAASAMIFVSCTSSSFTVQESIMASLSKTESYAITVPEDYPDESNSGRTTSMEIRKVLANCGVNASLLNSFPDYETVPKETRAKYDYIVEPTIAYWEDNVTTWSGKPDKLLLVIIIYRAKTAEIMDTFTIDASSSSIIFGDNDPVDLIKEPANVHYAKIIK
ncbi:MAG: DUF4823 domain-containing protein [Treponema sp.]|nr:DUF4823 domain-containing protein [Treponema sp.]